ncbi:MAG: DNA polymerase III subunit delta [Legionellales bacterium RIFCSPHIGHO2_12_FULL_37_14]|nr:MAG: DNA polymerase III subunit delta [Legionellales bacterium RIFCSPHIGHO2_12_FULL_37_14]
MILQYQNLLPHLKTALASFYLIVGKEIVLIDAAVLQISNAFRLFAANTTIEKTKIFIENNNDIENLYIKIQYPSMFCAKSFILAKYLKTTLDAKASSSLEKIINLSSKDYLIILEAPNLNPKNLQKMFLHSHNHLLQIPPFNAKTLLDFIKNMLSAEKISYKPNIPYLIADFTEGNAIYAKQCIEQCTLILDKNPILDESLLCEILRDEATFPLFTFVDTCVKGDLNQALRQLNLLRNNQTEPILLLFWLSKVTRQLLTLQYKLAHGENFATVCKELKIWEKQKSIFKNATINLTHTTLKNLIAYLANLDKKIKLTPGKYLWDDFELVVISFCDPSFKLAELTLL